MSDDKRPIIIVKRKINAAGHHGGAWKVAYADFVTAMMAFFMVMWLVASVTKEQRAAMFEYFKNPSMEVGKSVKAAPGQAGPGGASTAVIDMGGGMDAPKTMDTPDQGLSQLTPKVTEDDARKIAREAEKRQLETLLQELREAIDKSVAMEPFKDQLLLDITPEGLRIQIVDKQNRPMFDLGKSALKDYTGQILREVAKYLNTVPNRISLSGHTDSNAYGATRNYTNWELSADRANAARRALLEGGLEPAKIARVVGLASSVLFDKKNPFNPINRRISIIVMTKSAEATALSTDAPDVEVAREAIESGQASTAAPGAAVPGADATLPAADAAPAATAPATAASNAPATVAPATSQAALAAETAANKAAVRPAAVSPQRVAAAAEALAASKP
ncbi:MAG TPA: flagellar motor protein MotB [Steroidobacteraceae bacterium]|nr:flagellar motor protein MotB [Steroidobacteraceae bacterium]